MTAAVVLWTNEVFHPRANLYREGYRHCMVFIHSSDGWYGREYRPGAGEIIYPRVAEPDQDLLAMFAGNSPMLDRDLSRRRANVIETVINTRYQWRWVVYRKRCVYHVKHVLGIKARKVRRPYHLWEHLQPEPAKKKTSVVQAVASPFVPAK